MKKTAKFYADNEESRKKRLAYQKEYNKKPEQRKKRSELVKANRDSGTYGNGDGIDLSHTKKGIVKKKASVNRGSKGDMPGDKKARGGKGKK
jgi:hypothetical protein